MMNSFVLKHVSEPPKIIMANAEATVLSFVIFLVGIFVFYGFGFGCSMITSFVLGVIVFLVSQSIMIYKTMRDPFFLTVWMAGLACQKTKNLYQTRDNHFGD